MYVNDVIQINVSSAQTAISNGGYNIATSEPISVRELAEKIREITDSRSDIVYVDFRSAILSTLLWIFQI